MKRIIALIALMFVPVLSSAAIITVEKDISVVPRYDNTWDISNNTSYRWTGTNQSANDAYGLYGFDLSGYPGNTDFTLSLFHNHTSAPATEIGVYAVDYDAWTSSNQYNLPTNPFAFTTEQHVGTFGANSGTFNTWIDIELSSISSLLINDGYLTLMVRNISSGWNNFQPGTAYLTTSELSPVPVPAAVWLFGTGLVGFVGWARRKKKTA